MFLTSVAFLLLLGWLFRWLGLLILSYTCWLIHHFLLSWMRSSSSWMTYGVIFYTLVFPCLPFPPFLLGDLTFRCIFCYFARSSGYCCVCFLLLLPSACSHSWGNDAGPEISFHYDSSHEVIDTAALFFFFLKIFSCLRWYVISAVFWWLVNWMDLFSGGEPL
jgi:hypothetical protein